MGELELDRGALEARACVLVSRSIPYTLQPEGAPLPKELAATVLATAAMPELAELWPHLVSETAVYAMVPAGNTERPLSGRADAVVLDDYGRADTVLDWKSDVSPGPAQLREHAEQLTLYVRCNRRRRRGAVVYLTQRTVRWVGAAQNVASRARGQRDG